MGTRISTPLNVAALPPPEGPTRRCRSFDARDPGFVDPGQETTGALICFDANASDF